MSARNCDPTHRERINVDRVDPSVDRERDREVLRYRAPYPVVITAVGIRESGRRPASPLRHWRVCAVRCRVLRQRSAGSGGRLSRPG